MADSIMSITIRDVYRPCAPYQASGHPFRVSIHHCDGKPLWWKGVGYGWPGVWLTEKGHGGGYIHGQFKVPPGCYLVGAAAPANNVLTDWAYVNVGCDETECVNLVISPLGNCIKRMIVALLLGTAAPKGNPKPKEEVPLAEFMPREVKEATALLQRIADKIREDTNLPDTPTAAEIKRAAVEPKARPRRK